VPLSDASVRFCHWAGRNYLCSFWDEQRFRDNFSTWFDFEAFEQVEELESKSLAKQTFITIALARKKLPV
jgi:hypothetical protein